MIAEGVALAKDTEKVEKVDSSKKKATDNSGKNEASENNPSGKNKASITKKVDEPKNNEPRAKKAETFWCTNCLVIKDDLEGICKHMAGHDVSEDNTKQMIEKSIEDNRSKSRVVDENRKREENVEKKNVDKKKVVKKKREGIKWQMQNEIF